MNNIFIMGIVPINSLNVFIVSYCFPINFNAVVWTATNIYIVAERKRGLFEGEAPEMNAIQ